MILVTGATGFLGHNLIPELLAAGHQVRAFVRPGSQFQFLERLDVELAFGDVLAPETIDAAMRGCEYVVHGAGHFRMWGQSRPFERTNAEGTAYMMEVAARRAVRKFVHISTVVVIGRPEPGRPIDESHPVRPLDFYQRSKFDGENIVRMYYLTARVPAVILRPGAFYGPWGRYAWNRLFFEDPLRGIRIQIHRGRRITFPVFVPDVARAILAALNCGRPGQVYNVCGDPITHGEANTVISRLAGISPFRLNVPGWLMIWLARLMTAVADRVGREPYYPLNLAPYVFYDWPVSSEKARAEFNWRPTPFEEGARRTLEWYARLLPLRR